MAKPSYINVETAPLKLAAAFSAYPTSGKAPLKMQFTDRVLDHQVHGNGVSETEHTQPIRVLHIRIIKPESTLLA
jgi:PKD repeat protein